jgi:thiamine kinase
VTDALAAAAAIARIPGVEPARARYRLLSANFTNTLWLVETGERRLVLRLDTRHARALGLDRGTERTVLRQASAAGIAPRILHADPDGGVLVYEYLPGRSLRAENLARAENLEALAALLRRVHALPLSGVPFDAQGAAENYHALLQSHEEFRAVARHCRNVVASVAPPGERVCCHNDVVAGNVIATPALTLIDWEYACDNDPWFDLASLIGYHDLDEWQVDTFVGAYSGSSSGESRERLDVQLRLFDALQWMWLAVRQIALPEHAQQVRLAQLARRVH